MHVMEVAYTVRFPSVTTTVRNVGDFSRPTRSPVSLWNPPEEHASLQTPPCAYSDSKLKRGVQDNLACLEHWLDAKPCSRYVATLYAVSHEAQL